MYRSSISSSSRKDVKNKKTSFSPIRVVVRLGWSGARLAVPTANEDNDPYPPIRASSTTLMDLILRLESKLPQSLFREGATNVSSGDATLVCLRKVVPQSEWQHTTLQHVLDGDDGSSGVILTLDLGTGASAVDARNITTSTTVSDINAGTTNSLSSAISSAASSLHINPMPVVERSVIDLTASNILSPMSQSSGNKTATATSSPNAAIPKTLISPPEQAWNQILQSNFDAVSTDCLHALLKIIDNLLSRPNEPKFRSIRCANAAFDKKVGCVSGGYDFLFAIGFAPKYSTTLHSWGTAPSPEVLELLPDRESRDTLLRARAALVQSAIVDLGLDEKKLPPVPSSSTHMTTYPPNHTSRMNDSAPGFNVYKTHSHNIQSAALGAPDPYNLATAESTMSVTERQLNELQSKKEKLEREMQSNIETDRGLVAYREGGGPLRSDAASQSTAMAIGEGKSDSSLLAARMKRMEEERRKREEGGFTTKAMRDLEKMKKAKVYSHAQIRVNFSDGASLHAKFLPREKVSAIRSVIKSAFQSSLVESLDFDLYVAPPRRLLDDKKTLEEEDLVPAAKIHVSWTGHSSTLGNAPGWYLRDELFGEGTAVSAFPDAKSITGEPSTSSKIQGKASAADKNGGSQSKEEMLMQRMLGKKAGLLGGRKTSGENVDKDSEKKNGKPKWFKG